MVASAWFVVSALLVVGAGDGAPQDLGRRQEVVTTECASRPNLHGVRPRDAMAAALVQFGTERSQTFRDLLEDLRRAKVVLYVQVEHGPMNTPGGSLHYVGSGDCFRWLMATVESGTASLSSAQANRVWLTALLGHELQHAREVANEPAIRSAPAFDAYFRTVGIEVGRKSVDTEAARNIGKLVESELRSFGRHRGRDTGPAPARGILTSTVAMTAPASPRRP